MTAVAPARSRLRFHGLTVTAVEPAAGDGSAVVVTCQVPVELRSLFAFTPGQHVTARAVLDGKSVRRSYSLCSTPAELAELGTVRIGVRIVPGGVFSTYLGRVLSVGDVLDVLPPVGNFVTAPDPQRRRHYGAIVGGSGITPVLSLVATVLAVERNSRFTVLYGNRSLDSMMFADELADLKNRYPSRLHLLHAFSAEDPQFGLPGGRLDRDMLQGIFDRILEPAAVREWFLCGPAGLVRGAHRALADREAPLVHTELFHAEEKPGPTLRPVVSTTGDHEVTVRADGRSATVHMGPGERILDAVLTVRPDLPYSCTTGVCSTCRARVISGRVSMDRNWSLTPEEVAAGYTLTCRATPITEKVTVDYDAP
jgi:ring-1,2-phenylacetyl-CoA epoxidase subunit PaaE